MAGDEIQNRCLLLVSHISDIDDHGVMVSKIALHGRYGVAVVLQFLGKGFGLSWERGQAESAPEDEERGHVFAGLDMVDGRAVLHFLLVVAEEPFHHDAVGLGIFVGFCEFGEIIDSACRDNAISFSPGVFQAETLLF